VICYEILCDSKHPFGDYPSGLVYPIRVEFDRTYIDQIENIPIKIKDTVSKLLNNDPSQRPLIEEILSDFE